jgi:hypothetical protein
MFVQKHTQLVSLVAFSPEPKRVEKRFPKRIGFFGGVRVSWLSNRILGNIFLSDLLKIIVKL